MSQCWIGFKFNYDAAWERLNHDSFEPHQTSPTVVLHHSDSRATSDVEAAETVTPSRSRLTRERVDSPLAFEGGVTEIHHGSIFSTSWNW
jgi:hypothetical protein